MAGGIDWFRWHHGSVTDPKFGLVAKKAGASVAEVIAVWASLLEAASAAEDRGNAGSIDFEALDFALGMDDGKAQLIYGRMCERDLIDQETGRINAWEKRQPKRERDEADTSTSRVRAFRERQRQAQQGNANSGSETPRNTNETQETPRGEERRVEEKEEKETARKRAPSLPCPDDVDAQVWADWVAHRKAKRASVTATVVDGARSEAAKAGMSLEAFLRVWCRRGSQGLEAAWLKPDERGQSSEPEWAREKRERTLSLAGPFAARPSPVSKPLEVIDAVPLKLG